MTYTQDSIQEILVLDAPLPKVWDALTNPEKMKLWYDCEHGIEGKVEVGEEVVFLWGKERSRVRIEEKTPMERFAYRWVPAQATDAPITEEGTSLVTFTLSAEGDRTRLTLVESGLSNFASGARSKVFYMNSWGWDQCFIGLRKVVEDQEELADAMHFQVPLEAPVDRVWNLLSSGEGFRDGMGFHNFEGEIREGGECFFTYGDSRMRMRFETVTPKQQLSFRWTPGECSDAEIREDATTLVTIQLIGYEEKTLLLLREEGFRKFLALNGKHRFEMNTEGWNVEVLPAFKKYVEAV